ncbi:MAG: hypothetical protein IJ944_05430 [Clostridia bacterium]|nr:hypothetical protein [Clostridia bacterium]
MNDNIKSILTLIAILMYAIGLILFFVRLLGGYSSSNHTIIFCALMVGATVLAGIAKMFGNDNENDNK